MAANALNGTEFQKSFLLRGIDDGQAFFTTTKARWPIKPNEDDVFASPSAPIVDENPAHAVKSTVPPVLLPMREVSGALGKIASLLNNRELFSSHLDRGELRVSVKNGLISHKFDVVGPLVKASIRGDFKLANNWGKSVMNEPLTIWLEPDIANKYSPTAIVFPKKKFVQIPHCLSITGPLNDLTFKENKVGSGLMLSGQLTGLPGELIGILPIPLLNKEEDMVVNPLGLLRWLIPGGDED
ncbi:MAG TPA: hypothetical protein EYQ62_04665 [Verrucomicrobiales bacterium]|nr:hypothetical protein [Verrucomicrobiales bacterium]